MNPNEILTHVMQAYQSPQEPERLYALAGKYWRIMLSVAIFICLLAIAGGAYMLLLTFWNMNATSAQSGAAATLNRAELRRVVNGIADRQNYFNSIASSSNPVSDPSK